MTTPKLILSFTLLAIQGALLATGVYLLIKARRRDRSAQHQPTPAAYWQHRAHAGGTRNKALLLIIASFAVSHIASALITN